MPDVQLDIRTLLLIFAVTYGMQALSALLIWRLNPAERYTRDWAVASLCGVAANLLFGLRNIAPDFLSIVVGNVLVFTDLSLMALALRRFFGRPPRRPRTAPPRTNPSWPPTDAS